MTANISEGYGRSSLGDYLRFLEFAGASLNEVENALHFIKRNEIVAPGKLLLAEELRRASGNLLFGLMRLLRLKLKAKGSWQRGLVREGSIEYNFDYPDSMFHVPGSKFHEADVPGSKFQDAEARYDEGQ